MRGLRRRPLLNDVSFKLYPGEVLGVAALEGQGQEELFDCIAGSRRYDEGAILAHGKELKLRHPADAIRAGSSWCPPTGCWRCCSSVRSAKILRLPAFGGIRELGADRDARRARARRIGDHTPSNRHPRRIGTAPLERRQSAEGGDRALARQRLQHAAVLRSDPRHRYRHEAPDLCPGAGAGGCRLGGVAVHFGASRDRAGLRPRDRPVRRARGRRDAGRPRPTRPRCCAPRMGSPRWRRRLHDGAGRRQIAGHDGPGRRIAAASRRSSGARSGVTPACSACRPC